MRLWLTRRLMLGLWPLLSKLLTKHLLKLEAAGTSLDTADEDLKKMLADFRKEEFLRRRRLRNALPGEPGGSCRWATSRCWSPTWTPRPCPTAGCA